MFECIRQCLGQRARGAALAVEQLERHALSRFGTDTRQAAQRIDQSGQAGRINGHGFERLGTDLACSDPPILLVMP